MHEKHSLLAMGRLMSQALLLFSLLTFISADVIVESNDPLTVVKSEGRDDNSESESTRFRRQILGGRQSENDVGSKNWDIRNLDMSMFHADPNSGNQWIGYFYEEAIVPALQTNENLMTDCVVIEVRKDNQQREALFDLGKYMQLVPLEFEDMVVLIGLCGEIKSPTFTRRHAVALQNQPVLDPPAAGFGSVILPGTLWCGLGDIAHNYQDLGEKFELDSCCRDHDHCPVKISSFKSRYGIMNFGVGTRSHCLCDRILYDCLKRSTDPSAVSVGDVYFNFLRITCAAADTDGRDIQSTNMLYKCSNRDENNGCRMWVKRKNFQKKLKLIKYPAKF